MYLRVGIFFYGMRKLLGPIFNYLILWVSVKGSINCNHNDNPNHIIYTTLTLPLTLIRVDCQKWSQSGLCKIVLETS